MRTRHFLLVALFLCVLPTLQSSNEYYIEYGITLWESELVHQEYQNRNYSFVFQFDPVGKAYFNGKADAYAEILKDLRSRTPYTPPPSGPLPK